MKNTFLMLLNTMITLLSVIVLGLFIPIIISTFISLSTLTPFENCVNSSVFWVFGVVGIFIACIYINDFYKTQI